MNDHDYIKTNMDSVKKLDRNLFRRLSRWANDERDISDNDFQRGEKLIKDMESTFKKNGWSWCKETFIWFKHPAHGILLQAHAEYMEGIEDKTKSLADCAVDLINMVEGAIAAFGGKVPNV